jgi:cell division septal protein FtsQ
VKKSTLRTSLKSRRVVNRRKVFVRRFGKFFSFVVIGLAIFGFLLAFYEVFVNSEAFKVSEVEIVGAKTFVNSGDAQQLADRKSLGVHIMMLDAKEMEVVMQNNFQGAREIKVKKDYPSKVVVEITERVPLAVVFSNRSDDYFLIDEEGYVLGVIDEEKTNLPKVTYDGTLQVGYFLDKDLVPLYLELLNSLDETNLKASSVTVSERYVSFYLDDSIHVLVGRSKDLSNSIKILSELVKQLALEGAEISRIDLRFDKVIVE